MKSIISTNNAPAAIGPYSQATKLGNLIFASGQIPLDPKTMEVVSGGIEEQTNQVLTNLKMVLEEAESSMEKVVKVTVLMQDLGQFNDMNKAYAEFFAINPPARVAYQVAKLPRNVLVEIDAIAEA